MPTETGAAILTGLGSLEASGSEPVGLSIGDLMVWFFDGVVDPTINDQLYQDLQTAYTAGYTFTELIALIP